MIKSKKETFGIEIDLTGPNGNAFYLLGTASNLAKQLGLPIHITNRISTTMEFIQNNVK